VEPARTLILKVRDTKGYQGTIVECNAFKPAKRAVFLSQVKTESTLGVIYLDQGKQWSNSPLAPQEPVIAMSQAQLKGPSSVDRAPLCDDSVSSRPTFHHAQRKDRPVDSQIYELD
jgi:hypothetical protein